MTLRIEVDRLELRYGDFPALRELSFTLAGGGIYGLLGRNGSGKTSLLSVLSGFRPASGGQVLIDGQPVFENPDVTHRICLIREGGDTVEESERISEALRFAAALRPDWDADYAAALLDKFQLSPSKKINALSRGQRAALAVTLGLASRAPLTMFDEAYLGMDAPSRYAFYDELLRDFMENPRTIVLSTHLIEEVSSLFEEVVIIHQGRLLLHEETEGLRTRGATVLGPADTVDRVVSGLTVLSQKQLGATKSVVVHGQFDPQRRRQALDAGLEIGPLPLQDLFVHLTASNQENA